MNVTEGPALVKILRPECETPLYYSVNFVRRGGLMGFRAVTTRSIFSSPPVREEVSEDFRGLGEVAGRGCRY